MALTPEQIAATEFFVEDEYTLSKAARMVASGKYADVATAEAAFKSNWTGNMIDHYLQYGAAENANPSNAFDNTKYAETVAAAEGKDYSVVWAELTASGKSPLADYLDRGKDLGYAATAVPANEAVDTGSTPGVEGNTYALTAATDRGTAFEGSSDDDTYNAWIEQNMYTGGISNSLSSADRLDGGAGNDVLNAELVDEFVGASGEQKDSDVQPTTTNIEEVRIEARDENGTVVLDAKDMQDIDKIGSKNSDGDLVIENLNTLDSATGVIRKPGDLTITMDHTDNFNTDADASDLTVYFDEDYLVTSSTTQGSSLTVKINNVLNIKEGTNPVENFTGINFTVGTTAVAVDITGATTYDEVVAKINAQLTTLGLTTVTASKGNAENAYFSMDIGSYSAGELAGTFNPIVITNSGSETLVKGTVDLAQGQTDGDINNTWTETAATSITEPTSVKIELEKVGRDGEGGNLIIGGKNDDATGDTDVDQLDGIQIFNITVNGDNQKPSNLGQITSTNGALKTVNITSAANTATNPTYAALTVRGEDTAGAAATAFGGRVFNGVTQSLDTINASTFLGDLTIGTANADGSINLAATAFNVNTLTATGGGQIEFNANIQEESNPLTGMDIQTGTYSYTTGANTDTVRVNIDGDAVDAIGETFVLNTGEGADAVTMTMDAGVSQSTMNILHAAQGDYLEINTGGGNDNVNLNAYGNFNINAGAGNDFVRINSVDANGNATALNTTVGQGTGLQAWGGAAQSRVLYEAKLTVTFAGIESTVTIPTTSSSNFIASQLTINAAIKSAIEQSDELKMLIRATDVTGTQQLRIEALVGGENDLSIDVFQPQLVDTTAEVVAGQTVLINAADVTSLRQGLIATDAYDVDNNLDSEDLENAAEIEAALSVANENFHGSIAQNGLSNNDTTQETALNTGDDTGADLNADGAYQYMNQTTLGSDATIDVNYSTINLGNGDDLVVLHSNDLSMNRLVIDGSFGKNTVVNFHDLSPNDVDQNKFNVGQHQIDFTGILNNQVDASDAVAGTDNADSAQAIAVTLHDAANQFTANATATNDSNAVANGVNVLHYNEQTANSVSFATFTDSQLLSKLNDQAGSDTTVLGGLDHTSLTIAEYGVDLVGVTQKHIFMVENMQNLGEYKVFQATSTLDSANKTQLANGDVDDFTTVTLLGTLDFGYSINFNLTGAAGVSTLLNGLVTSADDGTTTVMIDGVATTVITDTTNTNNNTASAATVDLTQAVSGSSTVVNKDGDTVAVSTIKTVESTATLSATAAQAATMTNVTGAVTLTNGPTMAQINTIATNFSGVVTAATAVTDSTDASVLNVGLKTTTNTDLVLLDVNATAAASDLMALDAKTGSVIAADGVTNLTGTYAEITSAYAAKATNGLENDEKITVSGTLTVAEVNALQLLTSGEVVASVTTTAALAPTLTNNAATDVYALTLSDATVTVAQANTAAAFTDDAPGGVLTATIAADTATNLDTAITAASGNITGAKDMLTFTINDAAAANVDATHLSAIGGITAGAATVTNAVNIQGTTAEVEAALVTTATKVTAATSNVVFDDGTTTITATLLNAIDAATSGTITEATSNNFAITGLNGLTVSGTGAADNFQFATGDQGVAVTNVVKGTDTLDFTTAGWTTSNVDVAANDAIVANATDKAVYVFADGTDGTGTEAISNYTDMTDVVAFLEAGLGADDAETYVAVINDLANDTAYIYEIDVNAVATVANTIEVGDVTLVGTAKLTTDAAFAAADLA